MTIVMAIVSGILGAISYHIGLKQGYKQGRDNFEGFDRCAFEGLPCDWNFGGADE